MNSRYSMLIQWSDEDRAYVVTLPEFDGNKTHGASYEEAARNGREVLESLIEAYQVESWSLPEPALLSASLEGSGGVSQPEAQTLNTMTGVRTCNPVKRPSKPFCGERRKRREEPTGATALVQPFPTEGVLFANLDLTKPELESRVGQLPGKVCSYKMTSVSVDEGLLQQWGSGPNYQCGCLTLCTCAHKIRAEKRDPEEWLHDWWIAGFTSPKCDGGFWLFYLAQIGQVYRSMADLWAALSPQLRQAKSARHNRLGDAYQPNPTSTCLDVFDAAHYYPPMIGHSHRKDVSHESWKNDVEFYDGSYKRHDVYLVAKPELTFLWQTPRLYVKDHPRNKRWPSVADFLTKLREGA